jgi:aspartate ammonia-lyase
MKYRIEKDCLGEVKIPDQCLWGIHTQRALDNFKVSSSQVATSLIKALAVVKKACCLANTQLGFLPKNKTKAILSSCDEIIQGKHREQFPLDCLQGGAGTSTNMNINEVVANRALEIMGQNKGDYTALDPIEDVNLHQSTNDVYPTAVKLAVLWGLADLSVNIKLLQGVFQKKEKEFADIVKVGRTELQEAIPMTLGAEFSAFSEAIARDRWRVFKCEERIRQVNLGGTAIGTGLTAPRSYIFLVSEKLRELTGFGLTRGENLVDQTANIDSFVEVVGILRAHCSNIIKISNDLRLLNLLGEVEIEALQTGSSIMPGKANPVIFESAIQACLKADSDFSLVFEASSRSSLQINEFMPLVSHNIIEGIRIIVEVNNMLSKYIKTIKANPKICRKYFDNNPLIVTAFLPHLGYQKCQKLWKDFYKESKNGKITVRGFLEKKLGKEGVNKILSAQSLMSLGYRDNEKST